MNHSHYNPNPNNWIEVKVETNKLKILWWRIQEGVEGWYDEVVNFINYIKRYKSY